VRTLDIAKRLLDKGFYPPTVYFPLIIDEALLIEPTRPRRSETRTAAAAARRRDRAGGRGAGRRSDPAAPLAVRRPRGATGRRARTNLRWQPPSRRPSSRQIGILVIAYGGSLLRTSDRAERYGEETGEARITAQIDRAGKGPRPFRKPAARSPIHSSNCAIVVGLRTGPSRRPALRPSSWPPSGVMVLRRSGYAVVAMRAP
jgi:hypothetical protein